MIHCKRIAKNKNTIGNFMVGWSNSKGCTKISAKGEVWVLPKVMKTDNEVLEFLEAMGIGQPEGGVENA